MLLEKIAAAMSELAINPDYPFGSILTLPYETKMGKKQIEDWLKTAVGVRFESSSKSFLKALWDKRAIDGDKDLDNYQMLLPILVVMWFDELKEMYVACDLTDAWILYLMVKDEDKESVEDLITAMIEKMPLVGREDAYSIIFETRRKDDLDLVKRLFGLSGEVYVESLKAELTEIWSEVYFAMDPLPLARSQKLKGCLIREVNELQRQSKSNINGSKYCRDLWNEVRPWESSTR